MSRYALMISSVAGLFLSLIFCLSANNILGLWMMMELNMVSFIGFVHFSSFVSISLMKYFIAQSAGSLLLLTSVTIMMKFSMKAGFQAVTSLALAMKMGVPPVHFWLVSVFEDFTWHSVICMATIQKIIPIFLIMKLLPENAPVLAAASVITGAFMIFMQTRTKKIFAYLSIIGGSWMLLPSPEFNLSLSYLLVFGVGLVVWSTACGAGANFSSPENKINPQGGNKRLATLIAVLSLAGLPPALGFFIKINLVISSIMCSMNFLVPLLLSSAAVILWVFVGLTMAEWKLGMCGSWESTFLKTLNPFIFFCSLILLLGGMTLILLVSNCA